MRQYYESMTRQIDEAAADEAARVELRRYHYQRLAEFQHERLVHLIVTLFFGLLVLVFAGVLLGVLTLGSTVASLLAGLLALIVLVTELFYIAHYFRLENGVQRLYELTEKLR